MLLLCRIGGEICVANFVFEIRVFHRLMYWWADKTESGSAAVFSPQYVNFGYLK